MDFKPNIAVFLCNWCSYAASDTSGLKRQQYPTGIKIIRVMCSGRVDPEFVLKAFKKGYDGVMVLGCHPGDCHYKEGNYKTLKRVMLLKNVLREFGIEEERFILEWVAASEADKFNKVVNEAYENIKKIGPLKNINTEV